MASSYTSSSSTTTGGSTSTSTSRTYDSGTVSKNTQKKFDQYSGDYVAGKTVQDAYQNLQNTLANQPGAFQSDYTGQLNSIYNKIMNRDPFNYDMNSDALYQQYKNQYTQMGKTAMQDTMGQAAAMTGGYGSSYAQTAGQQTYQNYLSAINDKVLDFYDRAKSAYDTETGNLQSQYSMASDAYSRDYNQYRDTVSDWQADRSYAQSAYQNERDFDYSKWSADRSYWNNEYWNERKSSTTTDSKTTESSWSTTNSTSSTVSGGSGGTNKTKATEEDDKGNVYEMSTADATTSASGNTYPTMRFKLVK